MGHEAVEFTEIELYCNILSALKFFFHIFMLYNRFASFTDSFKMISQSNKAIFNVFTGAAYKLINVCRTDCCSFF